jgi:MFS family permease
LAPSADRIESAPTRAVQATLLVTATLSVMAGAIISPSLPALQEHFAATPRVDYLTRFIVTMPSLFMAAAAPFVGYVIDKFGRRRLLLAAVFLYALAGTSAAVIDSITAILVSRAFLGIATAGIMTSVGTLIGDLFTGSARDRMMGLRGAFSNFGGVIFLTLGGLLASAHWRAPFFIYLIALLMVPFILRYIHEPKPEESRGHGGGAGTPIPWLPIVATYGAAFLFGAAFYMIPTQIPFHLREMGFPDPSLAGASMATSTLATAIISIYFARIKARMSPGVMFVLGFVFTSAGFAFIAAATGLAAAFLGLAVFGIGMGLTTANFSIRLLELAPRRIRGRIMGGQATSIMMGFFLSPLFSQPIAKTWSITAAFGVASIALAFAALAFGVFLLRVRQQTVWANLRRLFGRAGQS